MAADERLLAQIALNGVCGGPSLVFSDQSEDLAADFIIVGGGSAGAVLANRLTEGRANDVVLIEAGGDGRNLLVQVPVGFARLVGNPKYDWCYPQEPDQSINGRSFMYSAGKMLGGGSSINGQVYIRGTRKDFDRWKSLGAVGWGFDDVLPFFIRSEHWLGSPRQGHGSLGELSVAPIRGHHPLCDVFLTGCREFGLPTLDDYNLGDADGAFLAVATQRNGWRCSTEKAFIRPAETRTNLNILTDAEVQEIIISEGRASGVRANKDGKLISIAARREVIVCAGAIGSPALLMRSGIGPGSVLKKAGIEVLCDRPGVGENLSEHVGVVQNKYVNRPTLNSQTGPISMVGHLLRFALSRSGPLAAPAVQAMALARTEAELDEPDIQLFFMPLAYDMEPDQRSVAHAGMPRRPAVSINASVCLPKGRGRVVLDSDRNISIQHELLGNPDDVATLIRGARLVDRLFRMPSLRSIVLSDRTPAPVPQNEQEWEDYVRAKAIPAYHPSGTCRMGSDPEAIVDSRLRVKGVSSLRVADASVMPCLPSTNTNAPTIMIGEKAADLIRADWVGS